MACSDPRCREFVGFAHLSSKNSVEFPSLNTGYRMRGVTVYNQNSSVGTWPFFFATHLLTSKWHALVLLDVAKEKGQADGVSILEWRQWIFCRNRVPPVQLVLETPYKIICNFNILVAHREFNGWHPYKSIFLKQRTIPVSVCYFRCFIKINSESKHVY